MVFTDEMFDDLVNDGQIVGFTIKNGMDTLNIVRHNETLMTKFFNGHQPEEVGFVLGLYYGRYLTLKEAQRLLTNNNQQ